MVQFSFSVRRATLLMFLVVAVVMTTSLAAGQVIPFPVNDGDFANTSSSFETGGLTNASFLSHPLIAFGANSSSNVTYNLTAPNGTLVDNSSSGSFSVGSGFGSGIYRVWNESSSESQRIDIFSPDNNVTGRISGGGKPGKTDIDFYHWLNSTEIDPGKNNAYNVSNSSWAAGEVRFSINSSRKKYWIAVNDTSSDYEYKVKKSLVETGSGRNKSSKAVSPLVKDFILTGKTVSVSGRVNLTGTGTGVSGLKLRLTGFSRNSDRSPYMERPPAKINFTDADGRFNFTGLSTVSGGGYSVEVMNYSYARKRVSGFRPDVNSTEAMMPGEEIENLTVTQNVGNVSVKLVGEKGTDNRYAIGVFSRSNQYIEAGVEPGKTVRFEGVKNGQYDVLAAKFSSKGRFLQTSSEEAFVSGNETSKELGFPPTVFFNGTVKTGSGSAVKGARLILENDTEEQFFQGRTNSSGDFSMRVVNDTRYSVRITPPFGKSYRINRTNFTVRSNFSNVKNFTLSSGSTLTGNITDGKGNRIEADIFAGNRTENSFGHDEVNSTDNGQYEISGLEKGLNYTVVVYPAKTSVDSSKLNLNISSKTTEKNISLKSVSYKLNGTVTDSSLNGLDAEIRLRNIDGSVSRSASSSNSGGFSFTDLGESFYSLSVVPSGDYPERRKIVDLDSNRTLNITLSGTKTVDGNITHSGSPVSGASVYAFNRSKESFDSDLTDSDGYYSLDLTKNRHEIQILPEGDLEPRFTSLKESTVSSNSLEKNFTLSSGVRLKGNISGNLTAKRNYTDLSGYINLRNATNDASGYTEFTGGQYSISGLKNASYTVYISVKNDSYREKLTEVSETDFGSTTNFTLDNTEGGRMIGITLQQEGDSVLSNASVYALGKEYTTDSNGEVNLPRQAQGSQVSVTANKDGYKSKSKTVNVKSKTVSTSFGTETKNWQNITLSLPSIQTSKFNVKVNLTYQNGDDSKRTVLFRSNESEVSQTGVSVTGSNGKTTVEDLVAGDYRVTVGIDDTELNTTTVSLSSGKSGTLNSTLDPDYSLWYEVQ